MVQEVGSLEVVIAIGVVVLGRGRVLLIEIETMPATSPAPGGYLAGAIDVRETARAAAVRELAEETASGSTRRD